MIRVLIADDSGLICDAMRTILDREEGIYVVGCARTLEETEFLLPHANLLLVGPALEGENILELVRCVHTPSARPAISSTMMSLVTTFLMSHAEITAKATKATATTMATVFADSSDRAVMREPYAVGWPGERPTDPADPARPTAHGAAGRSAAGSSGGASGARCCARRTTSRGSCRGGATPPFAHRVVHAG